MLDREKFIFFIVIDAFGYKALNRKIGNTAVTPFLNQIQNESFFASNFYSPAPYTEAAMVSVIGNILPLEKGGYILGNYCLDETLFEFLKKHNFSTLSTFSPYIADQANLRGVDDFIYTTLYDIQPLISYRFNYFNYLLKNKQAHIYDILICQYLLEDALYSWLTQLKEILAGSSTTRLLKTIASLNDHHQLNIVLNLLEKEILTFIKDKKNYTISLLASPNKHPLIALNNLFLRSTRPSSPSIDFPEAKEITHLISSEQDRINKILKKNYSFLTQYNYIINTTKIKGIKNGFRLAKKIYQYWHNNLIVEALNIYKNKVSLKNQLKFLLDQLYNNNSKSLFAYLHADDFHLPSIYYTPYYKNQQEELLSALNLLKHIDFNYYGNPAADLSAHYCDSCLSEFFSECLKSNKDVTIVISADHGYPLFQDPIRHITYNQTYREAFHIPFIVINTQSRLASQHSSHFQSYIDVKKLLFNLLNKKEKVAELSTPSDSEYILCEYAGPGCPDIWRKDLWYTYIDANYRASFECSLYESVTPSHCVDFFNLAIDPKETKATILNSDKKILPIIAELANTRRKYILKTNQSTNAFLDKVRKPDFLL